MHKLFILILPIFLISACATTVKVENSARFKCGEEVVDIDFLEDDSAVLKLNGKNYVLGSMVTASGVKYANNDISFWSKGDKASLKLENKTYPQCVQIIK